MRVVAGDTWVESLERFTPAGGLDVAALLFVLSFIVLVEWTLLQASPSLPPPFRLALGPRHMGKALQASPLAPAPPCEAASLRQRRHAPRGWTAPRRGIGPSSSGGRSFKA